MAREKKIPATLDPSMIEYAMDSCFHRLSGMREMNYVYNHRFIDPLIEAGYVEPDADRDEERGIWYKPTAAGLKWWFEQRAAEVKDVDAIQSHYVREMIEGKGIGAELEFCTERYYSAAFIGLRDGLFEFIRHRDYWPMRHSFEEYVIVRLTPKGYRYFDSLPRLELECA